MKKAFLVNFVLAITILLSFNSYAKDDVTARLQKQANDIATLKQNAKKELESLTPQIDLDHVMNSNVPSPREVGQIEAVSNRRIQYMIDNYTLPQLAQQAIQLNKAEIEQAKMDKKEIPAKLTREILEDREKIADYLRQYYKYRY